MVTTIHYGLMVNTRFVLLPTGELGLVACAVFVSGSLHCTTPQMQSRRFYSPLFDHPLVSHILASSLLVSSIPNNPHPTSHILLSHLPWSALIASSSPFEDASEARLAMRRAPPLSPRGREPRCKYWPMARLYMAARRHP